MDAAPLPKRVASDPRATASLPQRAALIYNPVKMQGASLRRLLAAGSRDADWGEPLFFETSLDDGGQDATARALDAGVAAVLVAGGDGTVRAVAERMRGTGIPLTILPGGTGNLLARNLNLPLDSPATMIRATFDGDAHPIDVGVASIVREDGTIDEHTFVVMAGIGLDAAMIANTNPQLKRSVGWVAYIDGAARSLPGAKPFRVLYQLDDHRVHSAKVQSMLFANCGALPAGIALIPEASISDGLLDVAVIQPSGPFGWMGVWRKVWWDNSVLRRSRAGRFVLQRRGRDASIRYLRGTSIETAPSTVRPVELDGDGFGEAARIRCRVDAGGLLVTLPRGHDTSRLGRAHTRPIAQPSQGEERPSATAAPM